MTTKRRARRIPNCAPRIPAYLFTGGKISQRERSKPVSARTAKLWAGAVITIVEVSQ